MPSTNSRIATTNLAVNTFPRVGSMKSCLALGLDTLNSLTRL